MGASGTGADTDTEARIQIIAGLAMGAFAAVALATALARAETGLTVVGALAGVLGAGLVAVAAVRLRRLHRNGRRDREGAGGQT
ncbi:MULTISPECIES: hypothetical protein [Streptomonospora]|uniref:Uncharacterized protein n=2 Tax=Streptomonospora TaxID=104204 RepID=A0ABV9SSZ5_9ACTN